MSQLWNKLASQKPRRVTVEIDGEQFEVRGMLQSMKNQMVLDCSKDTDGPTLEQRVLAWCVVEPGTDNPIQPSASQWDIPAEIASPLVSRCSKVCGFDDSELVADAVGKSEEAGSSD